MRSSGEERMADEGPRRGPPDEFADEPGCLYGWAWRIGRPQAGKPVFTLDIVQPRSAGDSHPVRHALPHGLDVLRFMLAGEPALQHRGERAIWRWQRHG